MELKVEQAAGVNPQQVTDEMLESYLQVTGMVLGQNDMLMYKNIAKTYGLNPYKREIHVAKSQKTGKVSFVTGYEVYIKRAELSGQLDGWEVTQVGQNENLAAVITIWRKGWTHPFKHEVYYAEAAANSPIWRDKPRFMLKKVAIGQGFRLCFPAELGGMPYEESELPNEPARAENKPAVVAEVMQGEVVTPPVVESTPLELLGQFFAKMKNEGKIEHADAKGIYLASKNLGDKEVFSLIENLTANIKANGKFVAGWQPVSHAHAEKLAAKAAAEEEAIDKAFFGELPPQPAVAAEEEELILY